MRPYALTILALLCLLTTSSFAQAPSAVSPVAAKPTAEMKAAGGSGSVAGTLATPEEKKPSNAPPPESKVDKEEPFTRSFFFSQSDMLDIDKASRHIIASNDVGNPTSEKIPQVRTISLEGIFYKSATDWMVWLNKYKVTPNISLKEIKDIKVEPDVVHLKWFDIGANKVLVLDMHPNEIYDIVTGVSLPDQTPVKLEIPQKGR